ncbi:tetratricopeptide repeat protein [Thalassospira profundimaris]|uniref:tetratricopeptide repeat protein n=1 Tax=Thalassospira profundimaris TaxID=502049 RepID=UPI000DEDB199|nr:tetratricopeptide repeat protein [Thalassospira profundimaris]
MIWLGIAGLSILSFITVFFTAFWRGKNPSAAGNITAATHSHAAPQKEAKPQYQIGDVVDDDDDDDDDDLEDETDYITGRHGRDQDVPNTPVVVADPGDKPVEAESIDRKRAVGVGLIAIVPVLAALGIYLWQGHPEMPARPYAERASERNIAAAAAASVDADDPDAQTDKQIRRLLGQIVISLESNPRNLQGWLVLARGSLRLGDIDRAVAAYRRAYALSGQNPLLAIEYADTRITAQGGHIDEVSRNLVLHALGQMPNHRLSRYYYGVMLEQQGHLEQSLHVLKDLVRDLPVDAPLHASTAAEIASLQAQIDAGKNGDNVENGKDDTAKQNNQDPVASERP